MHAQIDVSYSVEFSSECSDKDTLGLITVSTPIYSTVLEVLQLSVDTGGSRYRFSSSYFESLQNNDEPEGYFIDAIDGTTDEGSCSWFFYISTPSGFEFKPTLSVSLFRIPGEDIGVIMWFEILQSDEEQDAPQVNSQFMNALYIYYVIIIIIV